LEKLVRKPRKVVQKKENNSQMPKKSRKSRRSTLSSFSMQKVAAFGTEAPRIVPDSLTKLQLSQGM
jgi:hypothetical protein